MGKLFKLNERILLKITSFSSIFRTSIILSYFKKIGQMLKTLI